MRNPELRPCPMCGERAELHLIHGESYPAVRCTGCGLHLEVRYGKQHAADAWNRRVMGRRPINEYPEEQRPDVLVKTPSGANIIAYRSAARWYGYTGLHWLSFEPVEFMPLPGVGSVSAPGEGKSEE